MSPAPRSGEEERKEAMEALAVVTSQSPDARAKIEMYIELLEERCRLLSHQDPFRAMVIDLYSMIARVELFMSQISASSLASLLAKECAEAEAALSAARMKEFLLQSRDRRWATVLKEGGLMAVALTLIVELIRFLIINGATP
jgi:hypothetical protein